MRMVLSLLNLVCPHNIQGITEKEQPVVGHDIKYPQGCKHLTT